MSCADYIQALRITVAGEPSPRPLASLGIPEDLEALVLAPHPDDFDTVAVTLRFLRDQGNPIFLAVLTPAVSGVEDMDCDPPTAVAKAAMRAREQRESCRLFGLPLERLCFLALEEDADGHPIENAGNVARIANCLREKRPDVVFLPHGNDSNSGHRRIASILRNLAPHLGWPLAAFFNEEPKTTSMRSDVFTPFGEAEATWKGTLLRCHQSQHQRNLRRRNHGLDERILRVNRAAAEGLGR